MSKIGFKIKLTSDGEQGSGFGTERIDSLLPRNINSQIILPASHIKGIIRENLEILAIPYIGEDAIAKLFGEEDKKGEKGSALFHLNDAIAPKDAEIIEISRTKLNKFGTADSESLRTSEAVATGTVFTGSVITHRNLSNEYVQLLKLGLLSLFEVGGSRNRGAGACVLTIDNESKTPGAALKEIAGIDYKKIEPLNENTNKNTNSFSDKQVTMKLTFKAENPVCVPETPIVKNNMIKSGFSIPASAVQGALLHRINNMFSEEMATRCYESENFRAWPLLPTKNEKTLSVRVSLTHKISKLKNNKNEYVFGDDIIEPIVLKDVPKNAPLQASDGVLIIDDEKVWLWKSSEMARVITAHGVHNGQNEKERNFYTVEALAPTVFTGIISMPESVADLLEKTPEEDSFITLGKSRSVRGGGSLSAKKISSLEALPIIGSIEKSIFIVQSPLLIPKEIAKQPVHKIINKLVSDAGFGTVNKCSGSVNTLFGWNNQNKEKKFLEARYVIAPGSVFKLDNPVENIKELLVKGIGGGRKEGFGAVLPHPGVANHKYTPPPFAKKVSASEKNFGLEGFELWKKAKDSQLSASQISRVRELTKHSPEEAIAYLHRQKYERPANIWERWKEVIDKIEIEIKSDPENMVKVLKVCQDLLVADKEAN